MVPPFLDGVTRRDGRHRPSLSAAGRFRVRELFAVDSIRKNLSRWRVMTSWTDSDARQATDFEPAMPSNDVRTVRSS